MQDTADCEALLAPPLGYAERFCREIGDGHSAASALIGRMLEAPHPAVSAFGRSTVAIGGPGRRIMADGAHHGMWHGVPPCSAWVTKPDEIELIPAEYRHDNFGE